MIFDVFYEALYDLAGSLLYQCSRELGDGEQFGTQTKLKQPFYDLTKIAPISSVSFISFHQ